MTLRYQKYGTGQLPGNPMLSMATEMAEVFSRFSPQSPTSTVASGTENSIPFFGAWEALGPDLVKSGGASSPGINSYLVDFDSS
jgi:hypothetical protein